MKLYDSSIDRSSLKERKQVFYTVAAAAGNALLILLEAAVGLSIDKWQNLVILIILSLTLNLWCLSSMRRLYLRTLDSISHENDIIRLSLKNARLSALVSQLNPHFLFNALQFLQNEIINGTKENSCQIVQSMGNMLRYISLNDEAIVHLQKELDFARDYLLICEKIYEDNLRAEIDVEEGLEKLTVPKFILQPILENALKHGFDGAPYKNNIHVTARSENNCLILEVADDGKGIPADAIEQIRSAIQGPNSSPARSGIGLRNVHQRIRLICGDSYGVSIQKNEPTGLLIRLRLPRTDE